MKETKKIRVKVKKRKLKSKNICLFILFLVLISLGIYYILKINISNIYVIGNNLVSDKEIINNANLTDYPSYVLSFKNKVKKNILSNSYIKDVTIKKDNFKFYIYITEYKPLAIYNNKILLENNTLVDNIYNVNCIPIVINTIDTLSFSSSFSKVNDDVLSKISQIEFVPNEVDKKRYLLYMNDGNSVYITLSKINKLNSYNSIVSRMEGRNGIIYLDSGNYIELK